MKIFLLIPIQGKGQMKEPFWFIKERLEKLGHKITSEYLFDMDSNRFEDWKDSQELLKFHKKITEDIRKCDVFVVEVSHQRLSLGYWISLALEAGRPVVALAKNGLKYHLLSTLELNQNFTLYGYKDQADLEHELPMLVNFASEQQDTRFNFFISPKHQAYLDWISKHKKVPRSVYLRNLIDGDMQENTEYLESNLV